MKDPIDRFLEKYSASYMPVEREEREVSSLGSREPKETPIKLSDQERWDNSMKAMGWSHLIGMGGTEEETDDLKSYENSSDFVRKLNSYMKRQPK